MQTSLQKVSWIFTYGASCKSIRHEHFEEYKIIRGTGKLLVDECYTTVDKAYKYTLIHLEKRLRECSIRKFLAFMETRHKVVVQEICGYSCADASTSRTESNDIQMHPLYLVILEHKHRDNPTFESWTKLNRPTSGGLLQRHNVDTRGILVRKSKPKPLKRRHEDSGTVAAEEPTKTDDIGTLQAKIQKLQAANESKDIEISGLKVTNAQQEAATKLLEERIEREQAAHDEHSKTTTEHVTNLTTENAQLKLKISELESENTRLKNEELTPMLDVDATGRVRSQTKTDMHKFIDWETLYHRLNIKYEKKVQEVHNLKRHY
jgi:hypothetical protein